MTPPFARNDVRAAAVLFVLCMLLVWLAASMSNPTLATYAAVSGLLAALATIGFSTWSPVTLATRDRRKNA